MSNGPKSPAYRFCGTDSAALLFEDSIGTTLDSTGDRVKDLSSKLLTFLVVFLSTYFSPALLDVPSTPTDNRRPLLLEELFVGSTLAALVVPFSPA